MKKALIFDTFDQYTIRTQYVEKALQRCGYETEIFVADFDHVRKEYYPVKKESVHYIHARAYEKNLSFDRLFSHAQFAKACVKAAEETDNVDLIYAKVPPNSMIHEFGKYKKEHPEVKVWFDVLDMWPESLPVSDKIKKLGSPVFVQWRKRRDDLLACSDLITPECNLFKTELSKHNSDEHMHTVYLCQKERFLESDISVKDELHFLYCGTINNIIDIQLIGEFLWKVSRKKKVVVDVIGDGEHCRDFLLKLNEINVETHHHGYVYDEEKKKEIYRNAHFGLNCMKDTVFVGLTMKSLDYMSYGLPLINNIKGDTASYVTSCGIGINIGMDTLDEDAKRLCNMTQEEYEQMRSSVKSVFTDKLKEEVIIDQMCSLVNSL